MIVVADTSPVSNLHAVGSLNLLPELYGEILVPPAVAIELAQAADLALRVQDHPWIRVMAPTRQVAALDWHIELDPGEAEAITLALDLGAEVILVDELEARDEARRLGLRPTGLLGVLLLAKKQGLISSVGKAIRDLRQKTTFWMSREIINLVLRGAGEDPI
ncbi:MAG: DUF3368 domain-containing protein [Planctomycetes bacterium]|nr:DUF3368 domain-containing protein [Planctomycetota bacterium]